MTLQEFIAANTKWECAYCEPTSGWPNTWTIIWRGGRDGFGKIGNSFRNRGRPTPTTIAKYLKQELAKRFQSRLHCDAKAAAGIVYNPRNYE